MELREFAERVLMGTTLDEKLKLNPSIITDSSPGTAITLPDLPGRPQELIMAPKDARGNFPGVKHLENELERGKMMHFLANHELLATELMALVLLRFPDAPKEFRMGVFETLKEEQAHTLMYMRQMKNCGIEFGSLPVNDYFWRMVSPMEQPIDFVTRLSLTFEQANLDFSKHYATLFRQIGDTSTAKVLEKIYHDEIEHVGHGLKWFKLWKEKEQSDWQAFKTYLSFPLAPSKAKGMAPFNKEGRRAAGLNEEFIRELEYSEGSRGRTPNVLLFNANAEGYAKADACSLPYSPKQAERTLDLDLEMLPLTWARRDDVVLVHQKPSLAHISYLRNTGIQLPEWVTYEESLEDRKLGGMKPWAWTSDAISKLSKYASITTAKSASPFREALPQEYFSKALSSQLLKQIQPEEQSLRCDSFEMLEAFAAQQKGDTLMKAPYASAGRGHRKFVRAEGWVKSVKNWATKIIETQGYLIAEPHFHRLLDFSAQYEMNAAGEIKLRGMTRLINDAGGRFIGSYVHSKWISGTDEKLNQWLFRDAQVMHVYRHAIPELLSKELRHLAPLTAFGVDAFVYQDQQGEFHLRKIVELNLRFTMGRVALELLKKQGATAGFYQILRKSKMSCPIQQWLENANQDISRLSKENGSIVLNDPELAKEFYAIWHARPSAEALHRFMKTL